MWIWRRGAGIARDERDGCFGSFVGILNVKKEDLPRESDRWKTHLSREGAVFRGGPRRSVVMSYMSLSCFNGILHVARRGPFVEEVASAVVVELSTFSGAGCSSIELGDGSRARVRTPNVSPSLAVSLRLRRFSNSSAGFEPARRCSWTRRSAAIRSCGLASSIRRGFRISQNPLKRRDARLFWATSEGSVPSRGGGS